MNYLLYEFKTSQVVAATGNLAVLSKHRALDDYTGYGTKNSSIKPFFSYRAQGELFPYGLSIALESKAYACYQTTKGS